MNIYSGHRPDLLRLVGSGGLSALDVGCGSGGFATLLRTRGFRRIVGIEPDPARAADASTKVDELICSTIETALDSDLGGESFDLIVVADVLEHLVDPWTVTRRLAAHLSPEGRFLVSVPNVGGLEVLKQLVRRGDWRYDETGLFDKTHLRWFGRETLRSLLRQSGLEPEKWGAQLSFGVGPLYTTRLVDDASRLPSITIFQHHVVARRA